MSMPRIFGVRVIFSKIMFLFFLVCISFFMINGAPVVHAQSIFPVPPPPTSQPPPSTFAQPCVNNGSNVLGKDTGK